MKCVLVFAFHFAFDLGNVYGFVESGCKMCNNKIIFLKLFLRCPDVKSVQS